MTRATSGTGGPEEPLGSMVVATTAAAAFLDVDNDGRLDVYALASGTQSLFTQQTIKEDVQWARAQKS